MARNTKELRENSVAELEKQLRDYRQELLNTRLKKQTGQLERPHLLKELRRDIARHETLIGEKKSAEGAA